MSHTLTVEGELTIYRADELKAAFKEAIERDAELEIDLERVTEFDSAGVQLLLAAKKLAPDLRLARPSPAVVEVFELLALQSHFGSEA